MFDLTGKTALVTGASGGIGGAIARALHAQGATVALSGTRVEPLEALAAELGDRAHVTPCNLSDMDAVESLPKQAAEAMGGLDILVNNAGVYIGFGGPVREITDEMWRTLWSINVDGVFYCCRAAARIMIEAGNGGRIINIASTQAVSPGVGVTYDGSKAAVTQMTKALALELAPHRINVNALAPGPTWTREGDPPPTGGQPPAPTGDPLADTVADRIARLPAGHWGDPMEQGKAAVFLASSLSDFVTGIYLPVDGGWLTL